MNEIIIIIAKYFIFLAIIVVPFVFFQLQSRKIKKEFLIVLVVSGLLALLFAHIAGSLYYNARPFVVDHITPLISHTNTNGFPSDHTLLASLIGWVILRYSRKYGIFALILAAMIGSARVLAGVHHGIDIIASFLISGLAVLLVSLTLRLIARRKVDRTEQSAS